MRKKNKTQLSLIILFLFNSSLFSVYARDRLNTKSITPKPTFFEEDSIKIKECFIAIDSLYKEIDTLKDSVGHFEEALNNAKKLTYLKLPWDLLLVVLTAIATYFITTSRLKRERQYLKDDQKELCKTLSNALNKEVEDTLIRCCYIVECQGLNHVSKASLPNNAKKYMMESYSKVEKDYKKITSLTNIYNDLDRIQKHQDKAVEKIIDGNKEEGLKAQKNAVAFICNKLEGMKKEFKNIKEPLDEGLEIRSDLIKKVLGCPLKIKKSPSEVSYSVIGILFFKNKDNSDKCIKKEDIWTILDKVISNKFRDRVEEYNKTKDKFFEDVMTYLEEVNNDNLWFKEQVFEQLKRTEWFRGDFEDDVNELLNN